MKLSIIIPTLNEEENLHKTVQTLRQEFDGEILVVDGGSEDQTLHIARDLSLNVLQAPAGIARQCNLGALKAQGEILLFVACDSAPARGWMESIQSALDSPYIVGGSFHIKIEGEGWGYPILSYGGNFRANYMGIGLPDQGLFVRKQDYIDLGGMDSNSSIPFAKLSEDLKQKGEFVILPHLMHTSSRKWEEQGMLSTTWKHFKTYTKYLAERPNTSV